MTLVDGVGNSGGLDLLLGIEDDAGARWPDLRLGEGAVPGADLRAALPATGDGIAVLAAARSTVADPFRLDPQAVSTVLGSLRGSTGVTVVDLPLDACGQVALLVPAEVRAAAAAASLVARLVRSRTPVAVVARHRGWSGLGVADLERIIHAEVIAELGTVTRLSRATELGGLPTSLPRPLLTAARAVLAEVAA